MELTEIRGLPDKELLAKAQEIRQRIFQMKFKAQTEPVTNPAAIGDQKKVIARIHTVITERAQKGTKKLVRGSRAKRKATRESATLVKSTAAKRAAIVAERAAIRARKPGKSRKAPAAKAGTKKA